MEVVKSLGMKTYDDYQKRELLLLKCSCGVRLKKFKRDQDRRPKEKCGFCAYIPTLVMSIEAKHLSKGSTVVAFKVYPKENTKMTKWLDVIFECGDKKQKTRFSHKDNNDVDLKGITHWEDPWYTKEKQLDTQVETELPKELSEENSKIESVKESTTIQTESQSNPEGEIMSSSTKKPLEQQISIDTTKPQVPPTAQAPEVLDEQSMNMSKDLSASLTLLKELNKQLITTANGLTVSLAPESANAGQLIKVADEINSVISTNVDIVQTKINCFKEIRSNINLGLEIHRFMHETKSPKKRK